MNAAAKQTADLAELKRAAAAQVASFPQYANHFDGYKLVSVGAVVDGKGGLSFDAGEIAIGYYRPSFFHTQPGSWIVWSFKRGVDVSLPSNFYGCKEVA